MTIGTCSVIFILVLTTVAQTNPPTGKSPAPSEVGQPSQPTKISPILYKIFGNYGGWWNNLSDGEKDSFIDGFTTAMDRVNYMTARLCQSGIKELQPGANFDEKLSDNIKMCLIAQSFEFKVGSPMKPHLDVFYSEPLNMRIPAEFAMDYVRDELMNKKTAGQLLDELNDWRTTMNSHPKN